MRGRSEVIMRVMLSRRKVIRLVLVVESTQLVQSHDCVRLPEGREEGEEEEEAEEEGALVEGQE